MQNLKKGYEPWNLNDGDLTTAFIPDMTDKTEGSLVYHLSDTTNVRKLNIVQKFHQQCRSFPFRTGADTWETIGKLDKSLNTFYTYGYDQVYDVKITWGETAPSICEIITLECPKQTSEDLKKRRSNRQRPL